MEPGCTAKTWRTGVVLVFTFLSFHLIWVVITAIRSTDSVYQALSTSAYVRVTLLDYLIGSLFAAMYIHLLRGPPIVCFPPSLIAFLSPFLGNWLPLMYVCAVLSHASSLRPLIPGTVDAPNDPKRPRMVAAFFTLCLTVFVAVSLHAVFTENFSMALSVFRQNRTAAAMGQDVIAGYALVIVLIVVREGGFSRAALFWMVALLFFGNAVTCAYVVLIASRAVREGCSFRRAFLSPAGSKLNSASEESMLTMYNAI